MALVIPDDHYQALIPFKHDRVTRSAAITFGVRHLPGTLSPTDLADNLLVNFSAGWLSAIDNEVTFGPVTLTFDQGDQGRGSVTGSASATGGRSAVSTYSNSAVLVRKQTDRVGRPGRGRCFLPWVTNQTNVDEVGVLSNAALTAMQTAADNWLAAMETDDIEMVILHDENVPGTTTPSLVTGLLVDPTIGTQRRRMRF